MKRITKLITVLCLFLALLTVFTACEASKSEKTFSGSGFSITLDNSFYEKELVSLTAYYESTKMIVTVLKEEFSLFEGYVVVNSLAEYAELVISANGLENITASEKDGVTYFEYEKTVSGKDYKYYATVHKGSDAFWLVQFACETKNYEDLKADMETYAKSFKAE